MKSQVPHWGRMIKIYAKCKMSTKKNLLFFQAPAKMKLTRRSDNSAWAGSGQILGISRRRRFSDFFLHSWVNSSSFLFLSILNPDFYVVVRAIVQSTMYAIEYTFILCTIRLRFEIEIISVTNSNVIQKTYAFLPNSPKRSSKGQFCNS